jgi:hypothetical protein
MYGAVLPSHVAIYKATDRLPETPRILRVVNTFPFPDYPNIIFNGFPGHSE